MIALSLIAHIFTFPLCSGDGILGNTWKTTCRAEKYEFLMAFRKNTIHFEKYPQKITATFQSWGIQNICILATFLQFLRAFIFTWFSIIS